LEHATPTGACSQSSAVALPRNWGALTWGVVHLTWPFHTTATAPLLSVLPLPFRFATPIQRAAQSNNLSKLREAVQRNSNIDEPEIESGNTGKHRQSSLTQPRACISCLVLPAFRRLSWTRLLFIEVKGHGLVLLSCLTVMQHL